MTFVIGVRGTDTTGEGRGDGCHWVLLGNYHLSMLDHKMRIIFTGRSSFLEPILWATPRYNSCQTAFPIKEWKTLFPTSNLSSQCNVNMDRKLFFRRGSLGEGGRGVGVPRSLPNSLFTRLLNYHVPACTQQQNEVSAEERRQEMRHAKHLFMNCYHLIKWRQFLTQFVRCHLYI